jgi:hypothetical protein
MTLLPRYLILDWLYTWSIAQKKNQQKRAKIERVKASVFFA